MMRAAIARIVESMASAYERWQLENVIVQIDREIDGMRAQVLVNQVREKHLGKVRAEKARRLQVLTQHGIERRTADNVRAMK